ncbi:hypothetical protein GJAV_G00251520 [Gymnothorax javanicus]|nr:hypothetical protein GJAV_G00251520 [Gymnothorax javanicus]
MPSIVSAKQGLSLLFPSAVPQPPRIKRWEAGQGWIGEGHPFGVRAPRCDCNAEGPHYFGLSSTRETPIAVWWLKNGIKITENERVYLLANGSLYISGVENRKGDKSDEGCYQCLAQNKYGAILSQKACLTIASISPFVMQPTSVVVTEGFVARFACRITASPPPIITWEFNRVSLPLTTDRITVLPNGVLQIQGVERSDAGTYRCVATNIANRRRSAEAVLTVKPAPGPRPPQRPVIIAGPQNVSASLHQTAILECVAIGNPKPLISWSRADHKSIDVFNTRVLGNGNLVISDVKLQHAGVYVCRATTPGTRNFTIATANLAVLAPPSLVEWPESLTRPRAGTARFVCQAEGVPLPHITWLKNGEEVHSNGRIKMYNSKLVINQIIPEDDAIYQCLAENVQGSVLSTARLIVVMSEDRPSAPRNVRAETVSSCAILLAWERPLFNSDKVIAYSVHYMKAEGLNNEEYQVVIGNDTTRYIIDDLEPAHNYTFYIVAYMPMGASRMSDHVIQHTLEDVPLRAPELSLTSRSPTDILVSWQPLAAKLSRGVVSAYRLSYRTASDGSAHTVELPGDQAQHLLEGLQPDTIYLLRIAAATSVGWGEQSGWASHRTPKSSSTKVPLAPELQLEPLNCTTIVVRWQPPPGSAAGVQGYRLFYHEESQPEGAPIQLRAQDCQHTIGGLDPRKKYHVKLLAFSFLGEGYQADQTVSTPGCVSVRDRLVPPPPPPHHLYAKSNSSSSVHLHWGRPAFTSGQTVNYTVRCNPVGLQNASLVLYLQTAEQGLLIQDLEPNTRYEFAVRLHVDQLSSPWSPVVYQSTLPEGVKVTMIEEDVALVSWKQPDEPAVAVTRYTVLYASRRAWVSGEWQVLQTEGSITMALLENLKPGSTYLVKISASNVAGDGPFSNAVELSVRSDGSAKAQDPRRSRGPSEPRAFSDGFYHLDETSMTGIVVGVSIALACIVICVLILVYRGKARKSSATKMREGNREEPSVAVPLANGNQAEIVEAVVPMMSEVHFIDTKGGTDLIINSSGPVDPRSLRKKRWLFFGLKETSKQRRGQAQRRGGSACPYEPGRTVLRYEEESPLSSHQPAALQVLFGSGGGGEGSSEGSHETGDSGRYSHDETETTNLSSGQNSRPPSLQAEASGDSDDWPARVADDKLYLAVEIGNVAETACCHGELTSEPGSFQGGDGGLDGLAGPGVLLASPDKKKRKSNSQPPSFAPLSEYAPPPNPSSDHLVASNPFDDGYSVPSFKPLPSGNPYYGQSHYPGFSGYGPQRMSPHGPPRMPSPYGGPYPTRNQLQPFPQNQVGAGFNRPPGFNYGHHENPSYGNQPMFNNSNVPFPPSQPFRPGPGEGFSQIPQSNISQSTNADMGPGFGQEGTGAANAPPRPCADATPGFMPQQQQNNLGIPSAATPKQSSNEALSKNTPQGASPQKQGPGSEETLCADGTLDIKLKSRSAPVGPEGGQPNTVDKLNGIIHPGEDSLKNSPQPCASMELPSLEARRSRRSSSGGGGGGGAGGTKEATHPNRPSLSSAEPVYPCGICLNEVNDDQEAILCEASCQKWFHRICTGMTETAYNLLTAEASAVWGCDTCMEEKGAQLTRTRELAAPPAVNSEA